MKTKISRIGKKSLSVVIALIMIVSTMLVGMVSVSATITGYSAIYFTPGSNWRQADAIFKLEVDSNKIDFVCVDETNHIYKATLDSSKSYNNLKFLRINPADTSQAWDYSNTFSWISDNKSLNHYTMKDELWKSWDVDSSNGTWSTYSGGSTSYSISKGAEINGTFSVSATSATAGSTVTVTTSPVTGYEVDKVTYTANGSTQDASGSNNTYTFTMPAANVTVNVAFKQSTTPSATYYLTGRFGIKNDDGTMTYLAGSLNGWVDGITSNIKFTQVPGSTLYKLETGLTIKDLAANTGNSTWYFQISDGTNKYRPDTRADKAITIDDEKTPFGTGTSAGSFYFTGSDETGSVTLYFDTNGNKFYFEVEGSTPPGAYKLADKSNFGKVVYTVNGSTVTTANGKTVTSTQAVTVTASKVDNIHNFKVYFKCPSAPAYKPSVSLDGADPVKMIRGTELGTNYAGTLTFYWYYADLGQINSADAHTLTFTTARTRLNATMEDNFVYNEYYLAVDNLMSGTEVVDLTEFSGDAGKEHILNFYHSATNTVYSGVGTDKTLGFTNIDGTRYKMGTLVDNNGVATFSIRSATTMQMLSAQLTTVSKTQQALLDVNLDGRVDVKDATLMQRALVS